MSFQVFHFDPAFTVEVNPEFPGAGQWSCPVFSFGTDGDVVDSFVSPWGTPLVIRVIPRVGDEWVGMFPDGTGIVAATPAPNAACVVGGEAWLVDVRNPQAGAQHLLTWPTRVHAFMELPLLLVTDEVSIVAVGQRGVEWRSPRLCLDDLRVHGATGDDLRCTGFMGGGEETFAVDARTGRRVDGRYVS